MLCLQGSLDRRRLRLQLRQPGHDPALRALQQASNEHHPLHHPDSALPAPRSCPHRDHLRPLRPQVAHDREPVGPGHLTSRDSLRGHLCGLHRRACPLWRRDGRYLGPCCGHRAREYAYRCPGSVLRNSTTGLFRRVPPCRGGEYRRCATQRGGVQSYLPRRGWVLSPRGDHPDICARVEDLPQIQRRGK